MTKKSNIRKVVEIANMHERMHPDGFLLHVRYNDETAALLSYTYLNDVLYQSKDALIFEAIERDEKFIYLSDSYNKLELLELYSQRYWSMNSIQALAKVWDKQENIEVMQEFLVEENPEWDKLKDIVASKKPKKIFAVLSSNASTDEETYKGILNNLKDISHENGVMIYLFESKYQFIEQKRSIADLVIDIDNKFLTRIKKENIKLENELSNSIIDSYTLELPLIENLNCEMIEIDKNTEAISVLVKGTYDLTMQEVSIILEEIKEQIKEVLSSEVEVTLGVKIYDEVCPFERIIEITTYNNRKILDLLPLSINI